MAHPEPTLLHYPEAKAPTAARDREILPLMAAAPLRGGKPQDDVDGLALFDTVRSPRLL